MKKKNFHFPEDPLFYAICTIVVLIVFLFFARSKSNIEWIFVGCLSLATVALLLQLQKKSKDRTQQLAIELEETIKLNETRFRIAFEQASTGLAIVGLDGRWLTVNKSLCELLGYTESELLTLTFKDITHSEDLKGDLDALEDMLSGKTDTFRTEKRYFHKQGRVIWILLNVALFRDTRSRPLYFITHIQDISAHKESESQLNRAYEQLEEHVYKRTQQLRESNAALEKIRQELEIKVNERTKDLVESNAELKRKEKVMISLLEDLHLSQKKLVEKSDELQRSNQELEQFAYVASHDLQEPLRKIVSFGDLLTEALNQNNAEKIHSYIQKMQSSARRMSQLIKDILEYSRVGRATQAFESVSLTELIEEVKLDLNQRILDSKGIVTAKGLETIQADRTQMRQLFMNLIGNALKFHKPEEAPVVTIAGCRRGDFFEISVKDNGIGFESEYTEQIFKPFQRLHARHVYPGTGIGLAICQKIVARHHGVITVKSEVNSGSEFTVCLPFKQALEKVA